MWNWFENENIVYVHKLFRIKSVTDSFGDSTRETLSCVVKEILRRNQFNISRQNCPFSLTAVRQQIIVIVLQKKSSLCFVRICIVAFIVTRVVVVLVDLWQCFVNRQKLFYLQSTKSRKQIVYPEKKLLTLSELFVCDWRGKLLLLLWFSPTKGKSVESRLTGKSSDKQIFRWGYRSDPKRDRLSWWVFFLICKLDGNGRS